MEETWGMGCNYPYFRQAVPSEIVKLQIVLALWNWKIDFFLARVIGQ